MEISLWFLILSLFFPRIAIFSAWIFGGMPAHNGIPFWLCVFMSIFLARILVTVFVGMNMGTSSMWFIAHFILAVIDVIYWSVKGTKKSS